MGHLCGMSHPSPLDSILGQSLPMRGYLQRLFSQRTNRSTEIRLTYGIVWYGLTMIPNGVLVLDGEREPY